MFATAGEIGHDRLASGQFIVAVAAFGAPRPPALAADCPFAAVAMPPLGDSPCYEVWVSDVSVAWSASPGIRLARTGNSLFGVLDLAAAEEHDPQALGREAYETIFREAGAAGCPHILRAFNYLPRITAPDRGTERYRRFNEGRHEAFVSGGRAVQAAPAASALGTLGGAPAVYFLASSSPGRPIENPRQTSAYRYPPRYGVQSPSFSRAMLAGTDLFVSGTASIVGHASLHPEDAGAQAGEIIRNFEAILERCGSRLAGVAASALVKIYVRRPSDADAILDRLDVARFGGAMVVQGEICRDELLVEVEMFCRSDLLF